MKRHPPNSKRPPTIDARRGSKGDEVSPHADLRIVGGSLSGRTVPYSGDARTRPMKDRVREAVFNLLGYTVEGTLVIDLFAGTGALAFEALSRGAARAVLIEQHMPTADLIGDAARQLGLADQVEIVPGNVFIWGRRIAAATTGLPIDRPWLVFCSPPYDFYIERNDDTLGVLTTLIERAPAGSTFVVEADERFDFRLLPRAQSWDVRAYPPAVVGLLIGQAAREGEALEEDGALDEDGAIGP
jgi:16S rRNA (guanine966-N2)-methyltransferase